MDNWWYCVGCNEDNNFIEWDDDIDMDMLESDFVPKMYILKELLIESDFIVRLKDTNEYPKMVVFKYGMKVAIGSLKESGKFYLDQLINYLKFF